MDRNWSKTEVEALRESDLSVLHRHFYQILDRSYFEAIFRNLLKGVSAPVQLSPLGEGIHFRAWRVRVSEGNSLVLRVPQDPRWTPDFPETKHWVNALNRLAQKKIPLIPPFEVMVQAEGVGLLSPYGERDLDNLPLHWTPLEEVLELTENTLKNLGLKINDVFQLAHWQKIPFLMDLSDLHFV